MTDAIDRGVDRALRRLASSKIKKTLGPSRICECKKTAWASSDVWTAIVDVNRVGFLDLGWSVSMRGNDPACLMKNVGAETWRLHRLLMRAPPGCVVDHMNGNPLDNRGANLRVCTAAENSRNRRTQRGTHSGYKGVYIHHSGRWQAVIRFEGKKHSLGLYDTAEAAADAYDRGAVRMFGAFARTNKPPTSSV
jgi:hypothetical protein